MLSSEEVMQCKKMVRTCDAGMTTMFDALRDPCRYRIILVLQKQKEVCVSEVAEIIDASLPGASRHLKILEQGGLITRERRGQSICFRLNTNSHRTKDLLSFIQVHAINAQNA